MNLKETSMLFGGFSLMKGVFSMDCGDGNRMPLEKKSVPARGRMAGEEGSMHSNHQIPVLEGISQENYKDAVNVKEGESSLDEKWEYFDLGSEGVLRCNSKEMQFLNSRIKEVLPKREIPELWVDKKSYHVKCVGSEEKGVICSLCYGALGEEGREFCIACPFPAKSRICHSCFPDYMKMGDNKCMLNRRIGGESSEDIVCRKEMIPFIKEEAARPIRIFENYSGSFKEANKIELPCEDGAVKIPRNACRMILNDGLSVNFGEWMVELLRDKRIYSAGDGDDFFNAWLVLANGARLYLDSEGDLSMNADQVMELTPKEMRQISLLDDGGLGVLILLNYKMKIFFFFER
eukprot:GHVN01023025.1.p1 GENE.GHVN01023025.1~~GHVN01023025.1.p1  ORF type:complete len:348 (+),score=37.41 GHVN01023025.1:13-1056(+)